MFQKIIKRWVDLFLSLLLLFITWPLLVAIALIIYLSMRSPVLFCQERPGLEEKPFKLFKFRTMNNKKDDHGNLLPDKYRLTRVGKLMRKLSIDELPQLINVVRGDMSLVGPRPLLMEYLTKYTPEQSRRHQVKPGITGWAQVNGRNAITWEEKFKLDVWYVDNWNLLLDIRILWMTFIKVFKSEGISQEGQATMEKYRGPGI